MQLQLPTTSSLEHSAQCWTKWKKGFKYFLKASGITNSCHKRALLLHVAGPDTQDIFKPLTDTGTEYQHALNKLDEHFSTKKNILFERSVFHNTTQQKIESISTFHHTFKKVIFILWIWGFHRRVVLRSHHSHLQFNKIKKEIIDRVRHHIRQSIIERAINRTSSASFISHITEINTVNLSRNIKSRRIKFTLLRLKENQNFDHQNTHYKCQKQCNSNNQDEWSHCHKRNWGNDYRQSKNM